MVKSNLRALALFEATLEPIRPQAITSRQSYVQPLHEMQRPAEATALESHARRAQPANPPQEGTNVKGIEHQQPGGKPLTDTR
jgi:hypothetical protein